MNLFKAPLPPLDEEKIDQFLLTHSQCQFISILVGLYLMVFFVLGTYYSPTASVWPDFVWILFFGKILKLFGDIFEGVFGSWQNYETTLALFAIWQIFIVANGQILNKQFGPSGPTAHLHAAISIVCSWNFILHFAHQIKLN